jgi:alanyl-tRNA synthetase
MGVERTVSVLNGLEDNYLADMWKPIIEKIEQLSKKKYSENKKEMRIIADHIKAAVFILGDKVVPGNTEQGYVLRRLIRRAIRILKKIEVKEKNSVSKIGEEVISIYSDYEELKLNKKKILEELDKEQEKFEKTLDKGIKELEKIILKEKNIDGKNAFLLYQSYGFPIEIIKELAEEKGVKVKEKDFLEELNLHQELSRTASAGKFKAGLADDSIATTKLHTTTHLLLKSLKIVLKDEKIEQRGSNITPERLRFDFAFARKLKEEEIKAIEDLVNAQIQSSCEVIREEMSPEKAKQKGACGIFDKKYGEIVSVYSVGNFSKEICSGPHVKNTCELGKFKIQKEEASSSGVRRIKAILE